MLLRAYEVAKELGKALGWLEAMECLHGDPGAESGRARAVEWLTDTVSRIASGTALFGSVSQHYAEAQMIVDAHAYLVMYCLLKIRVNDDESLRSALVQIRKTLRDSELVLDHCTREAQAVLNRYKENGNEDF